jgi:hypothetical protein
MRIISRWKTWLISWAELADGLCGILSCGLYTLDASTAVRIWALHNAATRAIPDQDDTESAVASEHQSETFRIKRLELPLYVDFGAERHDVPVAQNDGWFFMVTGVDTRKIWCQYNGKTYHHLSLGESQEQCDAEYEKAFFRELALQNQLELDLGAEATAHLAKTCSAAPKPLRFKLEQIVCEQREIQAIKRSSARMKSAVSAVEAQVHNCE